MGEFGLGGDRWKIFFAHYLRQAGNVGDIEEDKEGAFDKRDEVELQQGQMSKGVGYGNTAETNSASRVAEDHDKLAIPAVNKCTGGKAKDEVGQHASSSDETGLAGRVRHGQYKKWVGEVRNLCANGRDNLPAPQEQIVAVMPERWRLCRLVRSFI